jgi:hypothetical protein
MAYKLTWSPRRSGRPALHNCLHRTRQPEPRDIVLRDIRVTGAETLERLRSRLRRSEKRYCSDTSSTLNIVGNVMSLVARN